MQYPKISVVMPVWNGEAHLREAVESILSQTFGDFEFLILDDGSTDSTPAILEEYASRDPRVRIIPLDHQGIVIALNRGVEEARSDWIARMDCDDIAHPERLALQWQAVQGNPKVVLCHTQIRIFGEDRYVTTTGRFIRSNALTILRLCFNCSIVHPTVMFHRNAFLACGGYLPEERHAEDFGLWGRLVGNGTIVGIPRPLLDFRVHHTSISKKKADVQIPLSLEIAKRHCRKFLHLDSNEATRAVTALRYHSTGSDLRDWFWLVCHCLPRLEQQSVELWIWAVKRSVFRVLYSLRKTVF